MLRAGMAGKPFKKGGMQRDFEVAERYHRPLRNQIQDSASLTQIASRLGLLVFYFAVYAPCPALISRVR